MSINFTKNGNSYQNLSVPSIAMPLVSGMLATMIASPPNSSYKQIKGALLQTVDVKSAFRGKGPHLRYRLGARRLAYHG